MKKTLAVILSVLMVVSLAALGVSAAEPTAIASAADFAAMTADGNYKLTADIAIDASWGAAEAAADVVTFTGTFDGNGHTVTVSAPLFVSLGGTVKNLVINGAVTKDGTANNTLSYAGAVAQSGAKNSTIVLDNIVNNASITFAYRGAGLIGQVFDGAVLTVNNCVNNGAISGGNMAGGIVGYIQGKTAAFTNCVNNGTVTIDITRSLNGLAGGIVGRFGGDNSLTAENDRAIVINNCLNTGKINGTSQTAGILAVGRGCKVDILNCTNKGEVISGYTANNDGTSDAGGIFGATGTEKGYYCLLTISKCVNEGNVTSKNARAAGIASYVWCGNNSGIYCHAEITDCVNCGTIAGGSFVAQILSYTNDLLAVEEGKRQPTVIKGVGLGSCVRCSESKRLETPDADGKNSAYFAVIGLSSSGAGANYDYDLTLVNTAKLDWVAYSEGTPANRIAIADKPDTIKLVDEAAAKAAASALGKIGYQAPAQGGETPDAPATGDNAVIVAVVAAVAVLGMGVALKARKA